MEISKELERKLRERYEDCLKLKHEGDLNEFGKGELFILRMLFLR
jgi:hypothetical protein